MLPRGTRASKRVEIGTEEPTYPVTAQDYYRRIYFEAIDLMMTLLTSGLISQALIRMQRLTLN